MSEERAVVFHCPYCAEEDLRPSEAGHGAWACQACRRVFSVKLIALSVDELERSAAALTTTPGRTT